MESCPNCGYCEHCGRSDRPAFVPAPYPVFPMTPSPTWWEAPWWTRTTCGDRIEFFGQHTTVGDTTSGM